MNRSLDTFSEGEDHVKISHFTRKGFHIEGVIHVGTNDWYELQWYQKMGIEHCLGFEPLYRCYFDYLNRPREDGVLLYPFALGDKNRMASLNIANGDGQSSSFFDTTSAYKQEFPDQQTISSIWAMILRFDDFMNHSPHIQPEHYNCLVLDAEGLELEILRGMGKYLPMFDFLNIECSGEPTYIGGPTAQEVVHYLEERGFKQDSPIEPHNDIMFIRKDI